MRLMRWLAVAAIVVPAIGVAAEPLARSRGELERVQRRVPTGPSIHGSPGQPTTSRHAVVRGGAFAPPRTTLFAAPAVATVALSQTASPLRARDILLLVRRRNL